METDSKIFHFKKSIPSHRCKYRNVTYIIKQTMALELGMSKGAHHWH